MERTRTGSTWAQRRLVRGIAVLAAAAAVLSACAAPGSSTAPTSAPATAAPATAAPATSVPAGSGVAIDVRQSASLGAYVAGKDGLSLYVFANDTAGTSNCSGDCAGSWPPLTVGSATEPVAATGITGALATITRADGTFQVTLGGAPLYYFAGDSAAGDTNGQDVGGVWNLASPAGTPVTGEPAASTDKPAASECEGRYCY